MIPSQSYRTSYGYQIKIRVKHNAQVITRKLPDCFRLINLYVYPWEISLDILNPFMKVSDATTFYKKQKNKKL